MQKKYRLTSSSSFQYIFRKGEKFSNELMVLYVVKAGNNKVGISVSKKVGNSVIRSRVKRRIGEAFRLIIEDLEGSHNFIVVAREPSAKAEYNGIAESLKNLLIRAKLFFKEKE